MRRLIHAIALAMVFHVALGVSLMRKSALQAQVGIPCTCVFEASSSPTSIPCLGDADLGSISCSQLGQQCLITGAATWTPANGSCVVNSANGGAVVPISGAIGPTYWFNPVNTYGASSPVNWGYLSTDCNGLNFGAQMQVVHYPITGTNPCVCDTSGPLQVTPVAAVMYSCESN
jgi:hypothetical protein